MSNYRGSKQKFNKYSEHDDRTVQYGPRKSFGGGFKKQSFTKNKNRGFYSAGRNAHPRSRLDDDDDVDMGGDGEGRGKSRFSPYSRGRGSAARSSGSSARGRSRGRGRPNSSRGRGRGYNNDQLQRLGMEAASSMTSLSRPATGGLITKSDWYKVLIPHGRKADKGFLLSSIMELVPTNFIPVQFHYEDNIAVFYVNNQKAATDIRRASKQITDPKTGYKVILMVRPCDAPASTMTADVIEKLKVCMSNRYDAATRSLNLDNLYDDEEMKQEGIHFILNRREVMSQVIKIIKDNIPELLGLKLNRNKLYGLKYLESLHDAAPGLEHLEVGHNQLKSDAELLSVRDLNLASLYLDGNPLCDRFNDETSYISAIRKKFPKLVKLDGHDLPPPIKFDIEAPVTLPDSQGSHFIDEGSKSLVCRFLQEYYTIFDSDDRQTLLNAYHEQAIFSLTCCFNKLVIGNQPKFNDYFSESRNLLKVPDSYRRQKLLKTGRLNVVALLNEIPKTQHDLNGLTVDMTHLSQAMMTFTITGVFKEKSDRGGNPCFRSFSRVFVTVPQGQGIVIVNEELFITNATQKQIKNSFKSTVASPGPSTSTVVSPAVAAVAGPSTSTGPSSGLPDTALRIEMVKQFSVASGMNNEWSEKCLAENNWDYEKSAQVFMGLKEKGSIPPQAFMK